jgi:hypothetical protein
VRMGSPPQTVAARPIVSPHAHASLPLPPPSLSGPPPLPMPISQVWLTPNPLSFSIPHHSPLPCIACPPPLPDQHPSLAHLPSLPLHPSSKYRPNHGGSHPCHDYPHRPARVSSMPARFSTCPCLERLECLTQPSVPTSTPDDWAPRP